MNHEPTLDYARARDHADVLRGFRDRFALPHVHGTPLLYLCGHSLGLMPRDARKLVEQELDDWARLGVLGHEQATRPWIPYHENLTAGLAYLAGARPEEVVAMNSLTINLHLMLASFYRPQGRRAKILIEAGAFSSDRHAVASQLAWHGFDPATHLIELGANADARGLSEQQLESSIAEHGAQIALVLWPGVQFRTGQSFDLPRIVQAAHRSGCIAGVDLAHSIGNTQPALDDCDADFAVWCSYKYLNAGPGAIGGCFVNRRHTDAAAPASRLHGWWGHDATTRFRMEPRFDAQPGAAAWQVSNPSVLAAAPLIASLDLFQQARLDRLREKSAALTGFLESLLQPLLASVELITPQNPAARGCQLSIRLRARANGRRVFDRLGELGAICDWRDPDVIRVAPVPLYNSFEDVFRFGERLTQALREVG